MGRSWSEFVSQDSTKNTDCYLGVTERLYARMRLDRNERPKNSWMLLNDNTPAFCALNVKQFLDSKSVCVIQHLPYSPDLALANFFSLPEIELALKGEYFSDICDIQCGMTELLKGVSLQVFQRALKDLYEKIPGLFGFFLGGGDYFAVS